MVKKVAIITNGGDAPGLNAVIRAIVKTAENNGIECYGYIEGYRGFEITNPYNKTASVKLSSNYITNVSDSIYDSFFLVADKGTPYKYRYSNFEMTIRWIMFIEYLINAPIFTYFGFYYSINSIKEYRNDEVKVKN